MKFILGMLLVRIGHALAVLSEKVVLAGARLEGRDGFE